MDIVLVAADRIVLLLRCGCWHRAIDNQTMEMDNASSSRTCSIVTSFSEVFGIASFQSAGPAAL
jgi:hypothetical protein